MNDSFLQTLRLAQKGESTAWGAVYQITQSRLRGIAASLLRKERQGHTLQATALINEAFLRIFRLQSDLAGKEHFYSICARAMKQVLIDHSRAARPAKKVSPDTLANVLADQSSAQNEVAAAAREVFGRFERVDPRAAQAIWMRCVEGRTIEEVSTIQQRDAWRVRADCDFGLRWMASRLR